MNKKTILGISFAAAAVAMLFGATPLVDALKPTYPGLASVEQADADYGYFNYKIIAKGPIPTDGSAGAFGYGIITQTADHDDNPETPEMPENVLAITTHLCVSDSFEQRTAIGNCPSQDTIGVLEALLNQDPGTDATYNDETFHAHILDLKPATEECIAAGSPENGLEVDVARTFEGVSPLFPEDPNFPTNNVSPDYPVNVIDNKIVVLDVEPTQVEDEILAAVSFGIVPLDDGNGHVTNLCLT